LDHKSGMKRYLLGAAALSVLVVTPLIGASAEAPPASTLLEVEIEALPLGDALRAFSVRSGVPIIFSEDGAQPSVHPPPDLAGAYCRVEWLCLTLGRAAGFAVPDFALVPMPQDMAPALLIERFDIRQTPPDTARFVLEDFSSILGLRSEDKYQGTIERAARALRPLSTRPEEDLLTLFERAAFAWLVADGDMHLKNIALLKTAPATERAFGSVRMAPLYDTLTTRVFPGYSNDRMALKLSGKDDGLTARDFTALARTMDILQGRARASLLRLTGALKSTGSDLKLPTLVESRPTALEVTTRVKDIVAARAEALEAQIEAL